MKESYEIYTEKLQDNYKEEFNKVEAYCMFLMKNYSDEKKEEVMSEVLDTFLNSQNDKKDIKELIGNNIAQYSRNVCKIEQKNMNLIKLLTFLKNMARWTLIIVLSNSFINKITNAYTGKVYVGVIVYGFMFTLISNNVELLCSSHYFLDKDDFGKIKNKHVISIIVKIILSIILIMIFNDNFSISIPVVISICISYIAIYYLVIKNNTPEVKNSTISENFISDIPKSMQLKFEKENEKRKSQGKNNISEEEFIKKEIKKVKSNLKYEKISVIWAVVFGIAYSLGCMNAEKELIRIILGGIMVFLLSLLLILKIRKSFIKSYKAELEFLEECRSKNIKYEDWYKNVK